MASSVLFVCLGNICRSPLAEAALRQYAHQKGIEVVVDSAGTGGWHVGSAPDPRAQRVAQRHGIDISGYKARQVKAADFKRFTHIIALDRNNLADLRRLQPTGATAELGLLLDHVAGRRGEDVIDPYFGEDAGFEVTWSDVHAAAESLLPKLTGP